MLGEGVWPRFGYNFTSFALMLSPHRQVTGGKFYAASQMIANIIGVAQAEMHDVPDSWPSLRDPQEVYKVSTLWRGESLLFSADGKYDLTQAVTHEHTSTQTHTVYANGQALHITYADDGRGAFDARGVLMQPGMLDQQPLFGKAKRFGWLLESVLHSPQSARMDTMMILDNDSQALVSLYRWSQGGVLRHVEIKTLRPA